MENQAQCFKHLLGNDEFLKVLRKSFKANGEADRILAMMEQAQLEEPTSELWDDFVNWLHDELPGGDINVLSIGWDSEGWGPGGNGFIAYVLKFGLVTMHSSDFSPDEHWEVFDEEKFEPWMTGDLNTDIVELSSDIYTGKQLKVFAAGFSIGDNSELKVHGRRGRRRKLP
jgi:hypothetical protein